MNEVEAQLFGGQAMVTRLRRALVRPPDPGLARALLSAHLASGAGLYADAALSKGDGGPTCLSRALLRNP